MAEKVEVDIEVKSNLEGSIAQLKELKKQLKQTAAGSAEFKQLYNQIDDLEDKIKGAKQGSSDWIDTLESAGGPVGALGKAINSAKVATVSFGTALKATGIGLIVAAVGGLVAAFNNVEGAGKKLEPLMIGIEKILGGIFSALEPLIDAFLELAMKALPYVTKYIGNFYSGIVALFTLLKEAGTGVGKILKGIFTLDYDAITAGWDQLTGSWNKAVTDFKSSMERYEAGTEKMTKTEKKNSDERQKILDDAAKKRKEEEEKARKEREEANKNADQAELDAFKETLDERAREEYEAGLKLAERRTAEAKAGRTDMTLIEEAYRKEIADIKKKYDDKDEEERKKKAEKEKEELLKKQADERGIALIGLQDKLDELDRKNKLIEGDYQQDLDRLAQQKQLLADQEAIELQNTELTELQKTEIRKKFADARRGITDQEIATEKSAAQAKHEINMAYLGLFEQFGSTLGQLAGKNKGLAIAAVVIQQAAAIGQIVANTAIANAKALAASPLTGGLPWTAINTISAGLSIASTVAAAVKSIQQIKSTNEQSASGGGATAGAAPTAPPPTYSGAPAAIGAPQIQTGGGANPSSQIAQTLSASQQRPVRAYVVSGEVSSQQALDRRTSVAATFSGG